VFEARLEQLALAIRRGTGAALGGAAGGKPLFRERRCYWMALASAQR